MARKLKHSRWSYAEDRRVLELAASSKSLEEIANRMNRKPETIRKVAIRWEFRCLTPGDGPRRRENESRSLKPPLDFRARRAPSRLDPIR